MTARALIAVLLCAAATRAPAQDVPEPAQTRPAAVEPMAPPAAKPHHVRRRKQPAHPQGPQPQAIHGPEAPATGPDGLIDARVGQSATPLASILGKNVQSPQGEDLGRVVDVLADADGRVRAAIIDFGGFLGVGTRRIAVDWPLLRFDPNSHDKALTLSVTREKLQSVPEYKDSNKPKLLMPPSGAAPPDAADNGHSKK